MIDFKSKIFSIVAVIGVVSVSPPAVAGESDFSHGERITKEVMSSESPEDSIESLSEDDREAFDLYNAPGEIEITKVENLDRQAGDYCRQDGVHFEQKAVLGHVLYTWWQTVEICGDPGINIESVNVIDAGGETKTPTWSYDGHASEPTAYPVGDGMWNVKSTESFSQIKLNRRTECITAVVVPSGEYSATQDCN